MKTENKTENVYKLYSSYLKHEDQSIVSEPQEVYATAFNDMVAVTNYDKDFAADLLDVSYKTVTRYQKEKKKLSPLQSEYILKTIALFNKGNKVVGTKLQGVTEDPSAVSWLLLKAVDSLSSPDNKVTYIFIVAEKPNYAYEPQIPRDDEENSRKRKAWTREEEELLLSDKPEVVAQVIGRTSQAVIQKIGLLKSTKPSYYRQLLNAAGDFYKNNNDNNNKISWKESEDIILFGFPNVKEAAKFLNYPVDKCFARISYLKYGKKDLYIKLKNHGDILKSMTDLKEKLKWAAEFIEGKKENSELLIKYLEMAEVFSRPNHNIVNIPPPATPLPSFPVFTPPPMPIPEVKQPQIVPPQSQVTSFIPPQIEPAINNNHKNFKQKLIEETEMVEQPAVIKNFIFTFNDLKVVFGKQPNSIRIEGNTLYID